MDNTHVRELFIDELEEVTGGAGTGGPVEELIQKIKDPNSTMACCEEGDCCNDPW